MSAGIDIRREVEGHGPSRRLLLWSVGMGVVGAIFFTVSPPGSMHDSIPAATVLMSAGIFCGFRVARRIHGQATRFLESSSTMTHERWKQIDSALNELAPRYWGATQTALKYFVLSYLLSIHLAFPISFASGLTWLLGSVAGLDGQLMALVSAVCIVMTVGSLSVVGSYYSMSMLGLRATRTAADKELRRRSQMKTRKKRSSLAYTIVFLPPEAVNDPGAVRRGLNTVAEEKIQQHMWPRLVSSSH